MEDLNPQWVESLYKQYKTDVFRLCLAILRNSHAAEDALQETFLKVQKGRTRYHETGREKIWLMQVARNASYDLLRKYQHETTLEDAALHSIIEHSVPSETEPSLEFLDTIAVLNRLDQDIICLRIIGGLPHKEIAKIMKITLHREKKRYERALQTLRRIYEEEQR